MRSGVLVKRLLILIAAEIAVAAVGGYGLRQGINRLNQAAERIAQAQEKMAACK